jgi:hypothetical protein
MAYSKLDARKDTLKNLKKMMRDEDDMGLGGKLQKITVAAPDAKGLKKGLSKAQEILEKRKEIFGDEKKAKKEEEECEEMEEEMEEENKLSPEEIKAKIEELKSMLDEDKSE